MDWYARLLLFAHLSCLCLSSPVHTTRLDSTNNAVLSKRAEWKAADLNNEFKGIYWNHLLEDADDGCTPEQIDKIVYASRYAMFMTALPRDDGGFEYSAAWTRYFGKYQSWLYKDEKRIVSADIMCK
jgi:hypothetical protein